MVAGIALGLAFACHRVQAVDTVFFSPTATGLDRSVGEWGIDAAWPDFNNVRQSIEHIGAANVDTVRVLVYYNDPLVDLGGGDFALSAASKAAVNVHLDRAREVGKQDIALTFGVGGAAAASDNPDDVVDPYYLSGAGIDVVNYARVIKATQEYINTQAGFEQSRIAAIEPYNEPDFNFLYTNPNVAQLQQDLNSVITLLKNDATLQQMGTLFVAPSVLNSDLAQQWYNQVPAATAGSSHLLAGSMTTYTNFIDAVNADGKPFINPEIHSMGEILVGAERGMALGMVWADVLRGRGTLIQASDGQRLGYAENLGRNAAAAVYRAPDGQVYAFAGGVERDYTPSDNAFRFVSDQPVYFNGIPVREFMLHTKSDEYPSAVDNDFVNYGSASSEGSYAKITLSDTGVPALDGHRWKIVSKQTGQVMEVVGAGLGNGALIGRAADDGGLNQLWEITRTRNGYYHLFNANSGLTAEIAGGGGSLNNGQDVRQWGTADNQFQQWYIDQAGADAFYIRNAHSNKYLDADQSPGSSNIFQWAGNGGLNQQWQLVLANPEPEDVLKADYRFNGNAMDSEGGNHATLNGGPTFTAGPTGQVLQMDGVDDYLTLPAGIASSEGITVTARVRWDGGAAWQRIFDFGNDTNQYMFLTPASGDGTMRFGITTGSNNREQVLETDALPTGEWVHLAVTLGGNTGVLYVNGTPRVAGQIILDPADFNPTQNYVGKSQWNDPLFHGAIADLQVYDYALHYTQIADLFAPLPGDYNADGRVDALDYAVWREALATGAPLAANETDTLGVTDAGDYLVWLNNYGAKTEVDGGNNGGGFAPAPVPEPATVWLLAMLALGGGRAIGARPR